VDKVDREDGEAKQGLKRMLLTLRRLATHSAFAGSGLFKRIEKVESCIPI
jgi:hypothetical protein